MSNFAAILPAAFVMIAGPQIISAVFFATSERWAPNSVAYVGGAAISITFFVAAAYLVAKGAKSAAGSSHESGANKAIYAVVLVLLLLAVVRTFIKRKESEPPKWMGKLQTATPRFAFVLGLLLLGVFPTDIITSVAVGSSLAAHHKSFVQALPFIGLTLLFLGIPSLLVILLGHRAQVVLPKVRDWMNENSWIVSEIVLLIFVVITANSLLSA